jgi:hypothetical protein
MGIRSDFLRYIDLMQENATCRFLGNEEDDEKKGDEYHGRAWEAYEEFELIEKTVARAVGADASKLLESVQLRDNDAFDRTGRGCPEFCVNGVWVKGCSSGLRTG